MHDGERLATLLTAVIRGSVVHRPYQEALVHWMYQTLMVRRQEEIDICSTTVLITLLGKHRYLNVTPYQGIVILSYPRWVSQSALAFDNF